MSNVTALPREARAIEAIAVEGIPLHDLYLSDMNPRQEADPEGIALLADSIAMIGLIQPIAGLRDEAGKVGVVAGGRRWRAIRLALERDPALAEQRPDLALVPVRLAPDEATARAWAAVENSAREDLHPADEIRAYGRMRESGADVPTIARTFGATEAHVYRRLALADLPAPVLDALKAGEITLGAAKAFTVAADAALALAVLDQIRGRETSEHRLKQMLQPAAINAASDRRARFVGIDTYRAAGGKTTAGLFAEATLLHDADLLDRLFHKKLKEAGDAEAGKWAWIETLDEAYVPYGMAEKLAWLYRVGGELTEEQANATTNWPNWRRPRSWTRTGRRNWTLCRRSSTAISPRRSAGLAAGSCAWRRTARSGWKAPMSAPGTAPPPSKPGFSPAMRHGRPRWPSFTPIPSHLVRPAKVPATPITKLKPCRQLPMASSFPTPNSQA